MLLQSSLALALFGLVTWAGTAVAQTGGAVGSVATMEGSVEIGRDGAWERAAAGSSIRTGDQIRTGTPGRARLVLHDDSVIIVDDGSLMKVDMSEHAPGDGPMTFLLNLVVGKVRAIVSEYYQEPLASYQIETATAVSAVRSTEFVVSYDSSGQVTEVLGLEGSVAVHSVLDRKRKGVNITRLMLTRVAKGKFPTPPQMIGEDDDSYRQLMGGVGFVAGGEPESLSQDKATPDEAADAGGSAMNPSLDAPPPVTPGADPVDRTTGQIIEQPTAPIGTGGAEVEF